MTEGDVEGLVAGAFDGCVEDTFEAEFVSLQRGNGFAKEFFRVLITSVNTGDIHLFPFDWDVVGFENRLHGLCNFCTNTITCLKVSASTSYVLPPQISIPFFIVPGIRVTVYLPPYLVGLKISDCIVAMATELNQHFFHSRCKQTKDKDVLLTMPGACERHTGVALAARSRD